MHFLILSSFAGSNYRWQIRIKKWFNLRFVNIICPLFLHNPQKRDILKNILADLSSPHSYSLVSINQKNTARPSWSTASGVFWFCCGWALHSFLPEIYTGTITELPEKLNRKSFFSCSKSPGFFLLSCRRKFFPIHFTNRLSRRSSSWYFLQTSTTITFSSNLSAAPSPLFSAVLSQDSPESVIFGTASCWIDDASSLAFWYRFSFQFSKSS